jgi:hypothetical protein
VAASCTPLGAKARWSTEKFRAVMRITASLANCEENLKCKGVLQHTSDLSAALPLDSSEWQHCLWIMVFGE